MQRFAHLCEQIDATTSTRAKAQALVDYLSQAPAADAAWALYFLAGGRPTRTLSTTRLREAAAQAAGLPEWLFEASYQVVGDLAETMAHLIEPAPAAERAAEPALGLADWMHQRLLPLKALPAEAQLPQLMAWLRTQEWAGRFLLIKLLSGGFRLGVSRQGVIRALAQHAGLEPAVVAQRMTGFTDKRHQPTEADLQRLCAPVPHGDAALAEQPWASGRPWPFFLAQPWHGQDPCTADAPTGALRDWLVEWKFDGIRAQVVKHQGEVWIWSRGEELISDTFPDLVQASRHWPDGTVLDGEILVSEPDGLAPPGWPFQPAPFARLQQRLGRQTQSKALLASHPARFMAYDVLVWEAQDRRAQAQHTRRALLEGPVQQACQVDVSPGVHARDWSDLAAQRLQARERGVEGFMLKHRDSAYGIGRSKAHGLWWKWKLDPLSLDAVLIYAQAGHGRRANLFTDYTFAVWNRPPHSPEEVEAVREAIARQEPPPDDPRGLRLVTVAKAYSGLSDAEITQVDRVIKRDTVNKFGPVRSVKPSLVFELGFEGISPSGRHKSGHALRFPRILRWRTDKPLHEADTLATLQSLSATPMTSENKGLSPARPSPAET